MRFDRESWRKLYVSESVEHRLMPLLCRGLRDYLIRHAKDDGTLIPDTGSPATDLARALGAHSDELEQIKRYVSVLIDDGYLQFSERRLSIRNFKRAQKARSKAAERQKRYRKKKRQEEQQDTGDENNDNASVTGDATGDATGNNNSNATGNGDKTRRDETRRDDDVVGDHAAAATGPFRMDLSWRPSPNTIAGFELAGVPPDFVHASVDAAKRHYQHTEDRCTDASWNQRVDKWVFRDWNNPTRRDEIRAGLRKTATREQEAVVAYTPGEA